jgi:hypothetical protein
MARPKGTTKPNSLVFIKVVLGVTKETEEWYKSLPEGTKAKTMRDAIALYRATNEQNRLPDINDRVNRIVNRDWLELLDDLIINGQL